MAAAMAAAVDRPNIRIEIKNDVVEDEAMEVDVDPSISNSQSDIEDGEINEPNEDAGSRNVVVVSPSNSPNVIVNKRQWMTIDGGFTTGVNIFDKEEQEKLHKRAQRFGIDPSDFKSMTDKELQDLHESLGISLDVEKDIRLEAIHMRGTNDMSTQDVFTYFNDYGPSSIEWVCDESCNVVWTDKISAARALHGLSQPIRGMPIEGQCDPFANVEEKKEDSDEEKNRSILLKDREIVLDMEKDDGEGPHVSDITIPVPPGYWRMGRPCPKAKCVLLRYAKKTDRKPFKAERFSEYYRKYGNPNYGGLKGFITEGKKLKLKGINGTRETVATEDIKKNPWGAIAKNWDKETSEPDEYDPRLAHVRYSSPRPLTATSGSIRDRIGVPKRQGSDTENESRVTSENAKKKTKVLRMRMHADDEEERVKNLQKKKLLMKKDDVPDLRSRLLKKEKDVDKEAERRRYERRSSERRNREQRKRHRSYNSDDEDFATNRQKSKVTIIIKKQRTPEVASTVWSRLDLEREKLRKRRQGHSSDSSSNSESSSSESSEDSSDDSSDKKKPKSVSRPGFDRTDSTSKDKQPLKTPLKIEINNDHYNKFRSENK